MPSAAVIFAKLEVPRLRIEDPDHFLSVVLLASPDFFWRYGTILEFDDPSRLRLHVGSAVADLYFNALGRELRLPPEVPVGFRLWVAVRLGLVCPVPNLDVTAFGDHRPAAPWALAGRAWLGLLMRLVVCCCVQHSFFRIRPPSLCVRLHVPATEAARDGRKMGD
jgi:hypothetical protein